MLISVVLEHGLSQDVISTHGYVIMPSNKDFYGRRELVIRNLTGLKHYLGH